MSSPGPDPPPSEPRGKPFQFSLSALLLLVTFVAVLAGFWGTYPQATSIAAMILVLASIQFLLVAAVCTVIYARGQIRAAAIGVLAGLGSGWYLGIGWGSWPRLWSTLGLMLIGAIVGAISAVWTRRWIERHGWDQPD